MKLTLKNLSMAIMMSTIVMGSSAMAADSNEKIVIAHRGASGYLRLPTGAYAARESDGLRAGGGLSGTGFGDDQRRQSGCSA